MRKLGTLFLCACVYLCAHGSVPHVCMCEASVLLKNNSLQKALKHNDECKAGALLLLFLLLSAVAKDS